MTTRNILTAYSQANETDKTDGAAWYRNARQAAENIAYRHGVSVIATVGVIAALSPRNKWNRNLQDAANIIKAWQENPHTADRIKVCTFKSGKNKALDILKADKDTLSQTVMAEILKGPKLREFANCILGNSEDVCIDGHAYSVWFGDRVTLANVPAIGVKLRAKIKADYIKAAKLLNITPAECQAITWCAWRRIHGIA